MKQHLIAAALLLLAGCASGPEQFSVTDTTGQGRGQAALNSDTAQCKYETMRAVAGALDPALAYDPTSRFGASGAMLGSSMIVEAQGRNLFMACLAARGWAADGR